MSRFFSQIVRTRFVPGNRTGSARTGTAPGAPKTSATTPAIPGPSTFKQRYVLTYTRSDVLFRASSSLSPTIDNTTLPIYLGLGPTSQAEIPTGQLVALINLIRDSRRVSFKCSYQQACLPKPEVPGSFPSFCVELACSLSPRVRVCVLIPGAPGYLFINSIYF